MDSDIKNVLVVGAGVMGHGIAQCFAQAGYNVWLMARRQTSLDRARELIASSLETLSGEGLVPADQVEAIKNRITRRAPTMGICAGMQVFFESSEESPGAAGLAVVPGRFGRFPSSVPVPQLGWNRVTPDSKGSSEGMIRPGWAYFANSYRILDAPEGFLASRAVYGDEFIAALESEIRSSSGGGPALLLCQFHPELSGPWGLGLYKRWLGVDSERGESR